MKIRRRDMARMIPFEPNFSITGVILRCELLRASKDAQERLSLVSAVALRGSGAKGRRRTSGRRRSGLLRRPLRGLGEFLQHAIALQLRQMIHEQHAVEMVDLVLDAGGEQALGVFLLHLAVET